jgi:hypothetical protein
MRKRCLQFLVGSILLLVFVSVGIPQEQVGGTAATVEVGATIEPFMSVTIVTAQTERKVPELPFKTLGSFVEGGGIGRGIIEFEALERPGFIEPDKHVQIIVSSNCTSWNVECSTQGLTSPDDFIPPERLYLRSFYTHHSADQGAGPGYEDLGVPKLVATGSVAEQLSYQVYFKLEVTWEDQPGDYEGILNFSVMPTP